MEYELIAHGWLSREPVWIRRGYKAAGRNGPIERTRTIDLRGAEEFPELSLDSLALSLLRSVQI